MKKIWIWLTACCILLSLTGCSGGDRKTITQAEAEEIAASCEALSGGMREALTGFSDEKGVAADIPGALDAVEAFADEQVEAGVLGRCIREENCVIMTLPSGIDIVYAPREEGMAGGGADSRLVSWEPQAGDLSFSLSAWDIHPAIAITLQGDSIDTGLIKLAENQDLGLQYEQEDRLRDQAVTVEAMKQLKPNSCVFFLGHGDITKLHGSMLDTSVVPSPETIRELYDDLVNKRVVVVGCDPQNKKLGVFGVTAAFFDHYYAGGGLENCAFFLAACHTCEDVGLRSALLRQGADVVIGTNDRVSIPYNCAMPRGFIEALNGSDYENPYPGNTYGQALELAKKKYNEDDLAKAFGVIPVETGSTQFLLFGNEEFQPGDPDCVYDYGRLYGGTDVSQVEDLVATDFRATQRSGDYGYALSYGKAVLLDYRGHDAEVILPDTVDGYPVIAVGQGCLRGNREVRRVVIPDTCFYVHAYAFADCENLEEIVIGNYVRALSRLTFVGSPVQKIHVYPGSFGEEYCKSMNLPCWDGSSPVEENRDLGYGFSAVYQYLERDISQPCGPVAEEGNAVYYWEYGMDSFDSPSSYLGGRFPFREKTSNTLICRLADGRELPVLQAEARGNIALGKDRIFYTDPGENNRLRSCSYTGEDRKQYALYGEIVYMDPDYDIMLLQSDGISLFLPEQTKGGALIPGEFLGCLDHVAYVGQREEKNLKIMAVDLLADRRWQVCEILTDDPAAYLTKVCVAGDKLYCGFGTVAGTGLIFQGGKVLEADLKGGTVNARASLSGGGFTVENGEVLTEGPTTYATYVRAEDRQFIEEDGTIYRTQLDNAVPEPLFLPEDTAALKLGQIGTAGVHTLTAAWAVKNGNQAYALLEESVAQDPNLVRPRYELVRVLMIHKDLETGLVEIIYDTAGEPVQACTEALEPAEAGETEQPETQAEMDPELVSDAFFEQVSLSGEICTFRIPRINLDTEAAQAINQEIYDALFPDARQSIAVIQQTGALAGETDNGYQEARSDGMEYEWVEKNGILSLITYDYSDPNATPQTRTKTYLVDSTTAEALPEAGILSRFDVTEEDVIAAIGHDFLNGVQESVMNSMEKDVRSCFEGTLALAREEGGRGYFLDEEGELCCSYPFLWMAGAGRYTDTCRVTGYEENPRYADWTE